MSKSVVIKTNSDGTQAGMPKICPDFRSGVDEAVKHVGPMGPSEKKKAREAVEGVTKENPNGRTVTVRGDDGKTARVVEAE